MLGAIEAHQEVAILADDLGQGLCAFPSVEGSAWYVVAYVRGVSVAAFRPSCVSAKGLFHVREGGVRVDAAAPWAMTDVLVRAIARRFLAGRLTIEDAPRYRWSLTSPDGPDASPHRLLRLRALYRAHA